MLIKTRILLLCLLVCSSACSKNDIDITDGYVPVRSESQMHFAAYFKIKNNTDNDITLKNISSQHFTSVSIHETQMENGISKMRHLTDGITIKSRQTIELAPYNMHIMLMQPQESIWSRDSIKLNLTFADGSKLSTDIPMRRKIQNNK